MKEEWKDIKGYRGKYQISNLGKVRSVERKLPHKRLGSWVRKGALLKQEVMKNGYSYTDLYMLGVRKKHRVHRLVAIAFIKNPKNKEEVNHKDTNKNNNNKGNLEWSTRLENAKHASINNLFPTKLTNNQVKKIRNLYCAGGYTHRSLASEFNVSHSIIGDILRGEMRRHI